MAQVKMSQSIYNITESAESSTLGYISQVGSQFGSFNYGSQKDMSVLGPDGLRRPTRKQQNSTLDQVCRGVPLQQLPG